MRRDYSLELDPKVREKMKKNLVYVAIFSIIMIFAGFTSAYIVSMGDTFWVKYPLPSGFWISTAMIITSSIFYILANRFAKQKNFKLLKVFMVLTTIAGFGFVYFQYKGYGQLVDKGANFRNSIMVTDGRYGDYFEIKYLDHFIEVNANDYLLDGKILTPEQMNKLRDFVKAFENKSNVKGYKITKPLAYGFTLYFEGEPVLLQNQQLVTSSGRKLQYLDMKRLEYLSMHIRDGRGDFFYKGKLGTDFDIYYKGKKLNYKNRNLYYKNKPLSAPLQLKINEALDVSTSYLYIITVLHLLHVAAAMIYLLKMVLLVFTPKTIAVDENGEQVDQHYSHGDAKDAKVSMVKMLSRENILSVKLGSIFWHFLGLLWIYLLIFLLYIH